MSASRTPPRSGGGTARGTTVTQGKGKQRSGTQAKGRQAAPARGKQAGAQAKGRQANTQAGGRQASTRAKGGGQAAAVKANQQAEQPVESAGPVWRRPWTLPRSMGWLPFTTLALSVLGLIDAGYQTYTHFSNTGLAGCSAKGDACVVVQTSPYAWVFGIPVAVLGLAFFVFMVVINSPQAWRAKNPLIHRVRLASVVVGMLFVLYLIYNELVRIGQVCPYCTSVHIITFILFALIVYQATAPAKPAPVPDKGPAQLPAKTTKGGARR
jgi:uncharacterized membrane protein